MKQLISLISLLFSFTLLSQRDSAYIQDIDGTNIYLIDFNGEEKIVSLWTESYGVGFVVETNIIPSEMIYIFDNELSLGSMFINRKVYLTYRENNEDQYRGVEITEIILADPKLKNSPLNIMEDNFTLISGNCFDDGCSFELLSSSGEMFFVSQLSDNFDHQMIESEEGGITLSSEFINKKFSVIYEIRIVYDEPSNTYSEQMIVLNMIEI